MLKLAWLKYITIISVPFLLSGCSQDLVSIPFDKLINNFSSSFPALWRLSTGVAYLFGIVFIMRGVYRFKQYGDMTTMMSSQRSLKEPVTLLVVGAALMFFPTTKAMLLASTFGYPDQAPIPPYSQSIGSLQVIPNMLKLIQLMGVIAFIRGWVQLSHGSQGGQNTFGKALTHIIGGLLAINIQGTFEMVQSTFLGR